MEEGDDHPTGFAEAIRAWRQRRGWTQEELSHASGLSTRAIRSLERGRTLRPRRTTVQMLADALQVPRARLMATVRRAVAGEAEAEAGADGALEADSVEAGGGGLPGGSIASGRNWPGGSIAGGGGLLGGSIASGEGLPAGGMTAESAPQQGNWPPIPRELPPDMADRDLDVRGIVAELVAGPTAPYRAAVVRVPSAEVAIRAAHHASAKFADGHLYASLAGTPPVAPIAVLRRFLRSLGVPERPGEASQDELAAAFRSVLAGRRVLVVVVDARSEAQVRPLIPAESRCALLVAFGPHPGVGPAASSPARPS